MWSCSERSVFDLVKPLELHLAMNAASIAAVLANTTQEPHCAWVDGEWVEGGHGGAGEWGLDGGRGRCVL